CLGSRRGADTTDDDESNEKCEQHERFDQRKRDDHKRLNLSGCTRVAGSTFSGTRTNEALADSCEAGRETESDSGSDRLGGVNGVKVIRCAFSSARRLSGGNDRGHHDRQSREKNILQFGHFNSLLFYGWRTVCSLYACIIPPRFRYSYDFILRGVICSCVP